jgi:hypothetical protein
MNPRLVLLCLLVVALLGEPIPIVSLASVSAQTAPIQSASGSVQQISSVVDEWIKDWKARNPEAISALYSQGANLYPALGRRVTGRDTPHALADYFKQFFDGLADTKAGNIISNWPPEVSGDLAIDEGFIQYEFKGECRSGTGEGACVVKGYYIMVLKLGSDGKWLIVSQHLTQIGPVNHV